MRKWVKIVIPSLLLAGCAVLCVVRWQAWFGMPDEPIWTGETIQYTFPTFTEDSVPGFEVTPRGWQDLASPHSLDILVLGDIHNKLTHAEYDTLAARLPQIDVVAQVGDWLDRGYPYYHQLLLREWTQSNLCGKPVIVTPGNHEYNKGLHKELSPVWKSAFGSGLDSLPSTLSIVEGANYYVDFPTMRLIVIDSNPFNRLVQMTRVLTWLRGAMKSANGRFIVVMMHHPVFSAAKQRSNPAIYATFRHALEEADLVLAGHDHSYMRRNSFVVLNSGGRVHPQRSALTDQDSTALSTPSVVHSLEPVYGVLSLCDSTESLRFTVYSLSDATVIDSLYVKHD